MKRVIIVHGWDGFPEEGWFPWLKEELEAKRFEVVVPQMPDASNPRIEAWVPKLAEAVGVADEETYFVGHSMGCKTICKYLEGLPEGVSVGGAVFVAGWLKRLTGLEGNDEERMGKEWLDASLDFSKVRLHLKNCVAIFSDDDPYVPLDNQDTFKNELNCYIHIQHGMGHFSGSTGTTELPIALEQLLFVATPRKRVSGVIVKGGKLLLIHRLKKGAEYYVLPGGGADDSDASLEDAMKRELREELSMETKIDRMLFHLTSPGREDYYLLVKDFSGEPKLADDGPEKLRSGPDNQYIFEWKTFEEFKKLKGFFPDPESDLRDKIIKSVHED